MGNSFNALLTAIRACTICEAALPLEPRPVVQVSPTARIVIIGQAPGKKVHETGVPWDDPSGATLRSWLGVSDDDFYDAAKVALIPMGFCYPGRGHSGDSPPRPECAPEWHDSLMQWLPEDRLEVIIGRYAQARYIAEPGSNLTETVARWERYLPGQIVLPHPSPRNRPWLTRNPWFEAEVLGVVRRRVADVLDTT